MVLSNPLPIAGKILPFPFSPHGGSMPHLTQYSLSPHESLPETGPRSVQPFYTAQPRYRLTDTPLSGNIGLNMIELFRKWEAV